MRLGEIKDLIYNNGNNIFLEEKDILINEPTIYNKP